MHLIASTSAAHRVRSPASLQPPVCLQVDMMFDAACERIREVAREVSYVL